MRELLRRTLSGVLSLLVLEAARAVAAKLAQSVSRAKSGRKKRPGS
jgi:hypothetical protein